VVVTSALMALTSCTNPGTVRLPRLGMRNMRPPAHEVRVNGIPVALKYCPVCDFRRPPRTSHCRESDQCVDKWDHYCPWVGTAVGRRNYCYFVLFLISCAGLAGFVGVNSIQHLRLTAKQLRVDNDELGAFAAWGRATGHAPITCLLVVYGAIATLLLAVLTSYHLYLISLNQTTYENVRGAYENGAVNPFDNGLLMNWAEVFFPSCLRTRSSTPPKHADEEATMLPGQSVELTACAECQLENGTEVSVS